MEPVCHPDCAQLNLQYANSQGIAYILSVPCVIGVAELLSLHQFDSVGCLDSTVKSPHSTQGYSQLLLSFHDGLKSLLVVTLRRTCICQSRKITKPTAARHRFNIKSGHINKTRCRNKKEINKGLFWQSRETGHHSPDYTHVSVQLTPD